MHIYYIGYYDTVRNQGEDRVFAPSAVDKMDYISSVLNRLGFGVTIISPSQTRLKKFFKGKTVELNAKTRLKLFSTPPHGNVVFKILRATMRRIQLLHFLLRHTKASDPVLVYHSLPLIDVVVLAHWARRFKLILEVEEIYQNAEPVSWLLRKLEYIVFAQADAFLFSTETLEEQLNAGHRPYAIIYGSYNTPPPTDAPRANNDDRTHVVYAGTLDRRKGGAAAAISAARALDDSYHIHILGFGSTQEVDAVRRETYEMSLLGGAIVTYEGVLSGPAYSAMLHSCHIGLSTQDPEGPFNHTSFPSKILSYLAHGLSVVSVRIPVVYRSRVSSVLAFYDHNDPDSIAQAIRRAKSAVAVPHSIISDLDRAFVRDLASVLSSLRRSIREHDA